MKPSKSSKAWLKRRESDPYVKLAQKEGYRSRAAFKLIEVNERDRLIKRGMSVVDLGAAPGGWSQIAAEKVGRAGRVISLDLLDMPSIRGVTFVRGDITSGALVAELRHAFGESQADLVLSDMAPNISGIRHADCARSLSLAEAALNVAQSVLKPGGALLIKVFEGVDVTSLKQQLNVCFEEVVTRKPKASRDRSREIYLLARGFRVIE
jgi:23S rRNA (uridine2552-2'-O)-methyltransferase